MGKNISSCECFCKDPADASHTHASHGARHGVSLTGSRGDDVCCGRSAGGFLCFLLCVLWLPQDSRGPSWFQIWEVAPQAPTWYTASSFGDGSPPNLADTPRDSSVCQGPGADLTHRAHEGGPRNHPEAWIRVLGPPYACPLFPLRDHSQPGELGQTAPLLVSSSPSVEWEAWSERCASLLQNLTP